MTVGELRKALEGLPDDMKVFIQTDIPFGCEPDEATPRRLLEIYGHDSDTSTELYFHIS